MPERIKVVVDLTADFDSEDDALKFAKAAEGKVKEMFDDQQFLDQKERHLEITSRVYEGK